MVKPLNVKYNKIYPIYHNKFPFQFISIVHFALNQSRGMKNVLIVLDEFSSFIWAYAVKDESAIFVKKHLENLFFTYGPPCLIRSDNSRSLLRADIIKDLLAKHGVKKTLLSNPFYSKHNASCERKIRVVRELIRSANLISNKPWPDILQELVYTYNITQTKIIVDNRTLLLSPFEKFYFRSPPEGIISAKNAVRNMSFSNSEDDITLLKRVVNDHVHKLQKIYNDNHNQKASESKLTPGDLCLYRRLSPPGPGQVANKYKPPFLNRLFICRSITGLTALIEDIISSNISKVSSTFLKKYLPRDDVFKMLPPDVGQAFDLDLNAETRQIIVDKLKSAGFEVDRNPGFILHPIPDELKEKLPPKQNKEKVSKTSTSSSILSSVASFRPKSQDPNLKDAFLSESDAQENNSPPSFTSRTKNTITKALEKVGKFIKRK